MAPVPLPPAEVIANAVLVYQGLELLKKPTQDLITKVFSGVADEIGEDLRERYSAYRARNAGRVVGRSVEMVEAAGIGAVEALPPRPRLLLELVERASREDDEALQESWAALLANAIAGVDVPPAYTAILADLRGIDCLVLDAMFDAHPEGRVEWHTEPGSNLAETTGLGPEELAVVLETLISKGVVDRQPPLIEQAGGGVVTLADQKAFQLTVLGYRFVRACRAPQPR